MEHDTLTTISNSPLSRNTEPVREDSGGCELIVNQSRHRRRQTTRQLISDFNFNYKTSVSILIVQSFTVNRAPPAITRSSHHDQNVRGWRGGAGMAAASHDNQMEIIASRNYLRRAGACARPRTPAREFHRTRVSPEANTMRFSFILNCCCCCSCI